MDDIKKYYKASRKTLLEVPLQKYGFKPYKSTYLARLTEGNIIQLISLGSTKYGGGINVSIIIRPLYCPNREFISSQPGNSIYLFKTKNKRDKSWSITNEPEIDVNLIEIKDLLEEYAIPFFDSTSSCQNIINSYKKNILGLSKYGNRIYWGAIGWEHYDFGHIYLAHGEYSNAKKHLKKCYKMFIKDDRDWAQKAANECVDVLAIIKSGQNSVDTYLTYILNESKEFFKIEKF